MLFDVGDTREEYNEKVNEAGGVANYVGQQGAILAGGAMLRRVGVKNRHNGDGPHKKVEGTSEGLELYRRTSNVGEFSHLEVSMQLRKVKRIAEQAGVGLDGVKIKIIRDPEMLRLPQAGWANPNGKEIQLYPNAF